MHWGWAMRQSEDLPDRRQEAHRRLQYRRGSYYRTRREWLIGEAIIGIVSCSTAMTGITGGLVDRMLDDTDSNEAWFFCFFLSGAALILLAYVESRCRAHDCSRGVLTRYAYLRSAALGVNFFAWGMAFLWLHFSSFLVASIYYQALPLAMFSLVGMLEHAKAIWLRPYQAGTTSLFRAGFRYLRSHL